MPGMNRQLIATPEAPAAIGPYAQAVRSGELVFCSGQIAIDPASGEMVGAEDVVAQTHQVMKNLSAVLEAGGTSLEGILKATIYVTDLGDFHAVNETYATYFATTDPPARATVEVSALPKNAKVEIDAIAVLPPADSVMGRLLRGDE